MMQERRVPSGWPSTRRLQCHWCESVPLWSAKSLAARHERKHQSTVAAILPSRNRLVRLFSSAARPGLAALESTSQKDLRFPDSC